MSKEHRDLMRAYIEAEEALIDAADQRRKEQGIPDHVPIETSDPEDPLLELKAKSDAAWNALQEYRNRSL